MVVSGYPIKNDEFENDEFLDHITVKFERNQMVRTIQSFELFDKTKWLNIFLQSVVGSVVSILKDFSVLKHIF